VKPIDNVFHPRAWARGTLKATRRSWIYLKQVSTLGPVQFAFAINFCLREDIASLKEESLFDSCRCNSCSVVYLQEFGFFALAVCLVLCHRIRQLHRLNRLIFQRVNLLATMPILEMQPLH
jgi:hypothetical protein